MFLLSRLLARLAAQSSQQQLVNSIWAGPHQHLSGQHGRLALSASQELEPGAHYAADSRDAHHPADSVQAFTQLAAN